MIRSGFSIVFCLGWLWDGRNRGQRTAKCAAETNFGTVSPVCGRMCPATRVALCAIGIGADHVAAAGPGGPRRVLFRPSMPAKTSRGSAAAAIWKMAQRLWRTRRAPVLMNRSRNEVSDLSRCLSVWPASAGSSPGCRPERATEAARRWPRTIVPSSFLVQDADRQKSHIWTIPRSLLVMEIIYFTTGKALRCRRCRNTYAVNGPRLGQRCSFLIGCT